MSAPAVSVVIPTRNRCAVLRATLMALATQTAPPDQLEVLVVADGSADGTAEMVRSLRVPYALRLLEQPARGVSYARNWGAAEARAPLLISFDDDVVATPGLVAAHLRAHKGPGERLVLGPYPLGLRGRPSLYQIVAQAWWSDRFHALGRPGHRFSFKDVGAGNFSIPTSLYARLGGFDTIFVGYGGKDYELGARVLKAGAALAYAPDALGDHCDQAGHTVERMLRRTREEARNDVILGRIHPELRPALSVAALFNPPLTARGRLLVRLAFAAPALGDHLARRLIGRAQRYEALLLRERWRRLMGDLKRYWYARGVAEQLASREAVDAYVAEGERAAGAWPRRVIRLELREGLTACAERLDRERPDEAELIFDGQRVGAIPPLPGAEALRGAHLPEALRGWQVTWELARMLGTAGAGPLPAPAVAREREGLWPTS